MEVKEKMKVYIINDKGNITLYKDRIKAERDFYKKAYEYREMIYSYKYVNHYENDKDNLIHYVNDRYKVFTLRLDEKEVIE